MGWPSAPKGPVTGSARGAGWIGTGMEATAITGTGVAAGTGLTVREWVWRLIAAMYRLASPKRIAAAHTTQELNTWVAG